MIEPIQARSEGVSGKCLYAQKIIMHRTLIIAETDSESRICSLWVAGLGRGARLFCESDFDLLASSGTKFSGAPKKQIIDWAHDHI
jgi:hypothetical protein